MWSFFLSPLALLSLAAPAFAHAFLERASPSAGSEVHASPPAIVITFTEAVEPAFSSIEVRDLQGRSATIGEPHIVANNGRQLMVDLQTLPAGKYTVIWHVTSVDTHKTQGRFDFTIAP